ncbi:large proline-rich protein BAG6 isoform X2 [Drosophila pseudoobscura]|uniref:Large proline-rich protein BAG6 n=1 Tax=Drosophila pseudoobscura pseudoobscura TaxID=46245 RepID=A0A6I8VJI8_DROPS|nr:large proline-rich protein BAG6 isoform X2 [Drosophila pseudoobscura]
MKINLKVKTLDARTHEFNIDNEITIRQFKDQIAEKTSIAAENQRIIYQGRVLADDKQVKEYDVAGKVLHVAERPPFSQRGTNARHNDEPMRPARTVTRPPPGSMRTSPYFRALDGMLVGTMSIPVPNGPGAGTRTPPGRFPNSSSFCINRITVALHMIDCANNIAAYLENPSVGLNNQSLDILQRGRWSMESTVVEVGVSSTDMPRNNNIIDMVQDAVTAALTRTGARNYTVLQLPTVYTNESGETMEPRAGEATLEGAAGAAADANGETTAATVIIEDVIDSDDEDGPDGASDRSATPTPEGDAEGAVGGQPAGSASAGAAASGPSAAESASNAPAGGDGVPANGGPNGATRRRTRPQVLGHVIQRYRGVQTRLAPFVDRYYDILENDPTFEENDTTARENAQRIFDRVSEAFHYLSHAQHAISDLMLDLSQPGPRVLTCRPILVEQSGYIRSNNIFAPHFTPLEVIQQATNNVDQRAPGARPPGLSRNVEEAARNTLSATAQLITHAGANYASAMARGNPRPNAANAAPAELPDAGSATTNPVPWTAVLARGAAREALASAEAAQVAQAAEAAVQMAVGAVAAIGIPTQGGPVEDPVDEPMVTRNAGPQASQPQPQPQSLGLDEAPDQSEGPRLPPRLRLYMPVALPPPNPQLDMARLIQAVVNRAANDTNDVQVEFSAPNIMSINLPVHVMAAAARPPAPGPESAPEATTESGQAAEEAATAANSSSSTGGASTSTGTRSGEQRANTLPTTATQTRSTSRPQIQIGGNNNWGGRIAPTHTAFDRFLPCNSHHIREPEPLPQNNNNSSANNNRRPNAAMEDADSPSSFIASAASAADVGEPSASASAVNNTDGIAEMVNFFTTPNRTSAVNMSVPPTEATATAAVPVTPTVTPTSSSPFSDRSSNLRSELSSFLNDSVFEGAPINEETIPGAISRALEWFTESLIFLPQYELPQYDSRESVTNILRQSLRLIMELCISAPSTVGQFEQNLKKICEQFRVRLFSVLLLCLGSDNAEIYWHLTMARLRNPLRRTSFQNQALWVYVDPRIPTQTDTADAQQFLVLRNAQTDLGTAGEPQFGAQPSRAFNLQQQPKQPNQPHQQAQAEVLDTDVEMTEVAGSSSSNSNSNSNTSTTATTTSNSVPVAETSLPPVVLGSESWHMSFPSDWLPAITRDLQTQAEQNSPQPPYSDAYISGMSAKRRKIIQTDKPTANVECLIASGVQRAIQSAGLGVNANGTAASSSVNVDAVIDSMTHDASLLASYTEAMRTNVRDRIKKDVDFTPSKYPQIAKFTEHK